MVYLNLSVNNINEAVEFYSKKLGIFDYQATRRLICNLPIEFIIDLNERGSDKHRESFNRDTQIISSFRITPNDRGDDLKLEIIEHLKENEVEFEEVINLGGHYLSFIDPSGNKFTLSANSGVFK